MSASTVSITATPSARRLPVEKKPDIDLAGPDAVAFGTGATVGGSENLSHSITRDVVLERSIDGIQVNMTLPSTGTTAWPIRSRTGRKGTLKPEKPRWKTVVSVFSKNFLILLVLVGFVQMIRKLAVNSGRSPESSFSIGVSEEFQSRIADVEALLKTTTMMMQVQLDVVDRKFGNEFRSLKTELKEFHKRRATFENELKKLDGRTENVDKSLVELSSMDLLSKDDLGKFFDELKKKNKGADNGFGDVNLDQIRAIAKGIVVNEIEKHAADGRGRVDYALSSAGAMIVKHSGVYGVGKGSIWLYTANRVPVQQESNTMLRPSFGEPGQCFSLKGSTGFVEIKLRNAIIPEAITLEHVAKSVAYDRSSAPKDCRVSGWLQGPDIAEQMVLLTEFTYDLEKSNIQTFNVLDSAGSVIVNTIRLDFESNHGSVSHTCIYRLRVHGHEPDSLMASES